MLSLVLCFSCSKDNTNKNNSISRTPPTSTSSHSGKELDPAEQLLAMSAIVDVLVQNKLITYIDGLRPPTSFSMHGGPLAWWYTDGFEMANVLSEALTEDVAIANFFNDVETAYPGGDLSKIPDVSSVIGIMKSKGYTTGTYNRLTL
jgi:hypothetical protein